MPQRVLIFGANGAIGHALCKQFLAGNWLVTGMVRDKTKINSTQHKNYQGLTDDLMAEGGEAEFLGGEKFNAIIWAQGLNHSDNILNVKIDVHLKIYEANVLYIIKTLNHLLNHNLIENNSRLTIISSIWQNIGRANKLSYMTTKSALKGLIQSLVIDLGNRGILVNAILPGPINSEMTRQNLTDLQIKKIKAMTPLLSLAELSEVIELAFFLSSENNSGITGQFIAADRGLSYVKSI